MVVEYPISRPNEGKAVDFLLIHGGSHGAWCWDGVVRELERLGCTGHTLDLPGSGDDAAPRVKVTFKDYISKVNGYIRRKNLQDFVLVGHSLAGILLPEITAANRDRVREVVFIAAFVLDKGERAIDLVAAERIPDYHRLADSSPEHSLMLSYPVALQRFFNDLTKVDADAAYARLTPQPFAPYLTPAEYGARSISAISRYIVCRNDQNLPIEQCRGLAEKLGGTIQEIEAGHDVMLSMPLALASLLVNGTIG